MKSLELQGYIWRPRITSNRSKLQRPDRVTVCSHSTKDATANVDTTLYDLQASRTGNSFGGTAASRQSLQRATLRWQSGRTAVVIWLQATGPQGIVLESAPLLEAEASESAAAETDDRLGAIARLAFAVVGVSDPAGCAEDPREFPGQFPQPRLRLPGLQGLRLLRTDCRTGSFDLARLSHRGIE